MKEKKKNRRGKGNGEVKDICVYERVEKRNGKGDKGKGRGRDRGERGKGKSSIYDRIRGKRRGMEEKQKGKGREERKGI